MDAIAKLFDSYNREARVYPALLVLAPFILIAACFFPKFFVDEFPKNMLAILLFLALFYAFSGMARSAGKRIEPKLYDAWGGVPTTVLLRHSDTTIDPTTKARFHKAIVAMSDGLVLPDEVAEAADRVAADAAYASGISALRERRRGDAWELLLKENAGYGFRRNLLGLRPAAVTIAVAIAIGFGLLSFFQIHDGGTLAAKLAIVEHAPLFVIFGILNIAIAAIWVFGVRAPWVRFAAYIYAAQMLRTLDAVP